MKKFKCMCFVGTRATVGVDYAGDIELSVVEEYGDGAIMWLTPDDADRMAKRLKKLAKKARELAE